MQRALPPASSIVGRREREDPGEAFDRRALCRREMGSGPGGKNEQLFVVVLQLERVPGEVGDLVPVEGDDGLAGCGKTATHGLPLRRVVDYL